MKCVCARSGHLIGGVLALIGGVLARARSLRAKLGYGTR